MKTITYEDKIEYLEAKKGVIQGHIAMIQKIHPKGDFRLEQMQLKLEVIESIIEDVISMKLILDSMNKK